VGTTNLDTCRFNSCLFNNNHLIDLNLLVDESVEEEDDDVDELPIEEVEQPESLPFEPVE
jgi:hypothetical protein